MWDGVRCGNCAVAAIALEQLAESAEGGFFFELERPSARPIAMEDVAVAAFVYERARDREIGKSISL